MMKEGERFKKQGFATLRDCATLKQRMKLEMRWADSKAAGLREPTSQGKEFGFVAETRWGP